MWTFGYRPLKVQVAIAEINNGQEHTCLRTTLEQWYVFFIEGTVWKWCKRFVIDSLFFSDGHHGTEIRCTPCHEGFFQPNNNSTLICKKIRQCTVQEGTPRLDAVCLRNDQTLEPTHQPTNGEFQSACKLGLGCIQGINNPGNLPWSDKRISYCSGCPGWKGRKWMPLITECGVRCKVVSKKVCLILRRSKNFGSMKKRRNGGLVVVQYTIGNPPKVPWTKPLRWNRTTCSSRVGLLLLSIL